MSIVTQDSGVFSGYTLASLRALVLRMLRVSNTAKYSPTAGTADYDWIDDALNRGQEEFVRNTRCLRTFAIIELLANYRVYRLPEDFLDLMAAYFYDSNLSAGYIQLPLKTREELNDEVSNWRTKTGDPRYIYLDRVHGSQSMCGFYPIPDTAGSTVSFDSEYGAVVTYDCPLFTFSGEYGVIIRMTDTDEYFFNTDAGVVGKITDLQGNIWLE